MDILSSIAQLSDTPSKSLRPFKQSQPLEDNDSDFFQQLNVPSDLTSAKEGTSHREREVSGTSSDSGFEEESESEKVYVRQSSAFPQGKRNSQTPILRQSQLSEGNKGFRGSHMNDIDNKSSQEQPLDEINKQERKMIIDSIPKAIPIITSNYSLKPDMMFGWKPQINIHGAPIPLYFDYEYFDVPINPLTGEEYDVVYYGHRFKDSLEMHKAFANKGKDSYKYKFPPNMNVLEAMAGGQRRKREEVSREFQGMNPILNERGGIINSQLFRQPCLIFDSKFESGNLDMVIQISDYEYDLYMRVDSNTRGHHQWFNFTIQNTTVKGKVKFNIVNFTKNASLYHQGMKINVQSKKELQARIDSGQKIENQGWTKGGENIVYKLSKLSQVPFGQKPNQNQLRMRRYFQVSFEYDFQYEHDKVQFAYSVPYTFTRLYNFLKETNIDHQRMQPSPDDQYIQETCLCKSLSGLEVPMLTVTSRINKANFEEIDQSEYDNDPDSLPLNKFKKHIIVCSRVHPGETNASFIMEGFIKFITSPSNPEAIELRKRIIFKIIPMTNPDGVIVGNYRTSLCGNDLNRQFISPNTKLHPTVCAIKSLISSIISSAKEPEPITSFIDIHGHSRKKSIFIYGPYFPLHNERYLKMRVLPKLLSEKTEMFRFYSCKFRIQKSKLKAARVVLWKEFGIMNCFTLEASFHGFINKDRQTIHLLTENLEKMGEILGGGFYEYQTLVEEDEKQRMILKQQMKKKKKKMKAKDLVNAYSRQQEQQINKLQEEERIANNDKSQSSHQQIQKRAQSFNLRQASNLQMINKRDSSQHSFVSSNNLITKVDTVLEENRSSAEESDLLKDDLNSSMIAHDFEVIKNETDLKRNKNKKGNQQVLRKHQSQKRTLKQIYKMLKKDVKSMTGELINDQLIAMQKKEHKHGYSSESNDDDEPSGPDCCEGEQSMDEDDLSPSELEELQGDILKAIENFDKFFNKPNVKTKKAKKKNSSQFKDQKITITQQNLDDTAKNSNTGTNKEKTGKVNLTAAQTFSNQMILNATKGQKKRQIAYQQTNSNSFRVRQFEQLNQPNKYILQQNQNQTKPTLGLGTLYGERIGSIMPQQAPLIVQGYLNKPQTLPIKSKGGQQYIIENSRINFTDLTDRDQQQLIYQGISNNVRNIIKSSNQSMINGTPSLNQRNSVLTSQGSLMIQSKSQDRCKPNDSSQTVNATKSFENYAQKPSHSSNARQIQNYQNQFIKELPLSAHQYIIDPFLQDQRIQIQEQNLRIGLATSSKSSRVILGADKDQIAGQVIESNRNLGQKLKDSQIKTPKSQNLNVKLSSPTQRSLYNEVPKPKPRPLQGLSNIGSIYSKHQPLELDGQILARDLSLGFPKAMAGQQQQFIQTSDNDKEYNQQPNSFKISSEQAQSMLQNQSVIIQNIIIGNFHNDQRIQVGSSPHSAFGGPTMDYQGDQQTQKRKRKKSKKKVVKDPNSHNSNYSVINNNNQGFQQSNDTLSQETYHKNQVKFNPLSHPYQERSNLDKRRTTENQGNIFVQRESRDGQSAVKSMPSTTGNHNKKKSIEYEQIMARHGIVPREQHKMNDQQSYNLKPLKDLIVSNLNQLKYMKGKLNQTDYPSESTKRQGRQTMNQKDTEMNKHSKRSLNPM